MRSTVERVLQPAMRLLLPAECLLCQQLIREPDDPVVCCVCRARWRQVGPPWCSRCGQPTLAGLDCTLCATWPPGLVVARSAVWLDEGPRRAVHALKYEGFRRLGSELGLLVGRLTLPEFEQRTAVVVPVPLAARRERARGYNQCDGLAAATAAAWGSTLRRDLLVRIHDTASQTALTPAARHANVAGAFAATPMARQCPRVVLVDDVFTTGATLAAAAGALLDAGVECVAAATFGRAALPNFSKE